MQISRCFAWGCAATTLLLTFSLAAQDSDAQIKARQALEQKMKEVQTQPPPVIEVEQPKPAPEPQPAPPPKQTPPPKAAAQPKPSASQPQFMPLPEATSPEAAEKLNDALRQKETEMNALRPVQPVNAEPPAPVAHSAPSQTQAKPTASSQTQTKPTATPGTAKQKAPAPAKGKPAVAAVAPPPGPPTGLSVTKEQRLADLNRQYAADKVTPEEYHKQRAKILSEP
jgi:hypothetical protein